MRCVPWRCKRVCGSARHGAAAGYAASDRQVQLALRRLRLLAERRRDVSTDSIARLLPGLVELGTADDIDLAAGSRCCIASGSKSQRCCVESGLRLWLLTSGLSLREARRRVARLFDSITVSLDGTEPRDVRGRPGTRCVRRGLRRHSCRGRGWCGAERACHRPAGQLRGAVGIRHAGAEARRAAGLVPGGRCQQPERVRQELPASQADVALRAGRPAPFRRRAHGARARPRGRFSDRASSRRVPGNCADCWTTTPPSAGWAIIRPCAATRRSSLPSSAPTVA